MKSQDQKKNAIHRHDEVAVMPGDHEARMSEVAGKLGS